MPDDFSDLWPEEGTSLGQGKKKRMRLAWPLMIACHDWMDRALYIYHLVRGEMRVIRKPSPEQWQRYTTAGIEIPYCTKLRADDLAHRIEYGKNQAAKKGLLPPDSAQ